MCQTTSPTHPVQTLRPFPQGWWPILLNPAPQLHSCSRSTPWRPLWISCRSSCSCTTALWCRWWCRTWGIYGHRGASPFPTLRGSILHFRRTTTWRKVANELTKLAQLLNYNFCFDLDRWSFSLTSHLDIHYKQPQKTINFCGCLWFFVVVCGEFARVISDIHYKVCGFD